ncbi:MAG: hypothetical protein HDR31_01365 [Mycoplasma sp.]|nr:hypothetical protein [Mycoplasma sp.]
MIFITEILDKKRIDPEANDKALFIDEYFFWTNLPIKKELTIKIIGIK